MNKMSRTKAREFAFKLIFKYDFHKDAKENIEEFLSSFLKENEVISQKNYIETIFLKFIEHQTEIDKFITENAKKWTMKSISSVGLALLRLGISEILYMPEIPTEVSVNEATNLSNRYQGKECASFVNGILGTFEKKSKL